jgi:HPr kinase/phosphorylase
MTHFLVEHSAMAGVPFFLSRYSAALLQSRLIGLIREIGLRRVVLHGVLVRVSGLGVLITGASGVGKTLCGLETLPGGLRGRR